MPRSRLLAQWLCAVLCAISPTGRGRRAGRLGRRRAGTQACQDAWHSCAKPEPTPSGTLVQEECCCLLAVRCDDRSGVSGARELSPEGAVVSAHRGCRAAVGVAAVVLASARKHGIGDDDMLHSYRHPVRAFEFVHAMPACSKFAI